MRYALKFLWGLALSELVTPMIQGMRSKHRGRHPAYHCGWVWAALPASRQIYEEAYQSAVQQRKMVFSPEHLRTMRRGGILDSTNRLTHRGALVLNTAVNYREVFPVANELGAKPAYYLTA